jgi:hypothetical protein
MEDRERMAAEAVAIYEGLFELGHLRDDAAARRRSRDGERLTNVVGFRGGPPLGGPPVVWHADVPEASEAGR